MKSRTKVFLIIILVLGGLVLLRIFSSRATSERRSAARAAFEKVTVKVMPAEKGDLNFVLSYAGNIKAKDEISVFSRVSGKLIEYTVNEGDSVQKGQAIAYVDRDETGLKYELAKVDSPISGIVGRTLLDKGANVLPAVTSLISGTPVAIIVNMEEMIVRLNISESDIPYLKKGLKAKIRVDAYPDENFTGEISKISEMADPETRTLPIEITIPNPGHRLKSGMFGRIKIIAFVLKDRLVIAQDALVQELGVNYVFTVENQTAKKKKITTGIKEDSRIEVLEGLKESEKVIVFGQQGLKDGTAVEVGQE